jgi:hypothetical protein
MKVPESETIPARSDSGATEPPDILHKVHLEVFDAPPVILATAVLNLLLTIAANEYENTETQLDLVLHH